MLVPTAVLREVSGLATDEAVRLGIEVIDATDAQLTEVAQVVGGPLSVPDRLCLALARDTSAVCVTSDTALQRACTRTGVPWLWGPTLLVHAVAAGVLAPPDALRIAVALRATNPLLPPEAIDRLAAMLPEAATGTIPAAALPRLEPRSASGPKEP